MADKYGDMERGIFIIRGENVVLLGEIVSSVMFLCNLKDGALKFCVVMGKSCKNRLLEVLSFRFEENLVTSSEKPRKPP